MRIVPLLLLAAAPALVSAAAAQVSVNNQALDTLGSGAPSARPHHTAPAHHPPRPPGPAHPAPHGRPALVVKPKPGLPAATPPPARGVPEGVPPVPIMPGAPVIPTAPPPAAGIPPAVPAPTHPVAPPSPVPVANSATGETAPIAGGVRITFGAGSADLNPTTFAALQSFARLVKDQPVGIDVIATAAGSADDPSTPRRISLSRALAARAVLINDGIASTRIYPRALGANPGDGPPDRVDLVEHKVTPAPDTEPKP